MQSYAWLSELGFGWEEKLIKLFGEIPVWKNAPKQMEFAIEATIR